VQHVDPDLSVMSAERMDTLLSHQLQIPRLNVWLLLVFGSGALLLASIGLYSTLSNVVRLRTRELAIRQAVGAAPSAIRWLVLKQAVVLTAAGVAVGVAAAMAGGRAIESLLFETRPADPLTLAAAIAVLVCATLTAAYWPMRRATRADVAALLRAD
jgi:putative ABC transport system permease protein